MAPSDRRFRTPAGQRGGDAVLGLLTALMAFVFFFFLLIMLGNELLTEEGMDAAFPWLSLSALVLAALSAHHLTARWHWLRIEADAMVLGARPFRRRRIRLTHLAFLHAGSKYGMQSPAEREKAVPLTLETQAGRKERIYLAPGDARDAMGLLVERCPWVGGIDVEGELVMPREAGAVARVRERAKRFYLYSGLPLSLLAGGVLVVLWNEGLDLITEHENPVMATYQLLLVFPLGGYGVWALRRYWALRRHHPPEGGS